MTLVQSLCAIVGSDAPSFRLAGEDLSALTVADLLDAAARYRLDLETHVPDALRARFAEVQRAHANETREWLSRYNKSLASRIRGYGALGSTMGWVYPWPVVAILGLCEVERGMTRMRAWGLAGRAAKSAGCSRAQIQGRVKEGAE